MEPTVLDTGPFLLRKNRSQPSKSQDDQLINFDHLRETKDLAVKMTRQIPGVT
jgi:hypothetical protein